MRQSLGSEYAIWRLLRMTGHQLQKARNESINILLPRAFVIALLASFYALAFIISPYWLMPASSAGKIVILILTISFGGVWCYFSAGNLQIRVDVQHYLTFVILLIGLIALNYQSLISDIPWRGDESHHINKTLALVTRISTTWIVIACIVFTLFLYTVWKRSKLAIVLGGLILLGVIIGYTYTNLIPKDPMLFLRYPFISYWFYAMVPILATSITNHYHEILYRVIPILCVVAIVWVFLQNLTLAAGPIKFLWGLAIATIPIVFYYSSILYLELLPSFLMLIVCLNIKSLLHDNFEKIRQTPAWYALILVGFIKETTITFLFCFLICRLAIFLIRRRSLDARQDGKATQTIAPYILQELAIVFSTLFPLMLYLLLRSTLADIRSFVPDISSLLNISVYLAIGRSFVEQFAVFLLLFIAGCILLILKKEYSIVCFYVLTFLFIPLFHVVDNSIYAGYSRFNLFILPVVLAGTTVFIKQLSEYKIKIGIIIACIAISVSLLLSPIYPDGSKQPLWGNYLTDTSEHYYPYRAALSWLKKVHPNSHILLVSAYYPYNFTFYFNQLDWQPHYEVSRPDKPKDYAEVTTLSEILAKAEKESFSVVLYQVLGKDTLLPKKIGHFRLEKIIHNDAHILAIYTKTNNMPAVDIARFANTSLSINLAGMKVIRQPNQKHHQHILNYLTKGRTSLDCNKKIS